MMPSLKTPTAALAKIDNWPCALRICRDLTCPNCGYPEMGQTVGSTTGVELLYCRKCLLTVEVEAAR